MNSSPASQPKHASRQLGICAKPSSNALKISPRRAALEARQCQMAPGPARSPALSPEQLLHQASPPSPEREEVKGRIFEDRTMEMAWKLDLVGKDGRCAYRDESGSAAEGDSQAVLPAPPCLPVYSFSVPNSFFQTQFSVSKSTHAVTSAPPSKQLD